MTTEIWIKVWQSLVMGFAFLIPFAFCRAADIGFGAVLASKLDNLTFDFKKFFKGILYTFVTLISLACLITGITMIPELLNYYDITDTDILKNSIDVIMIVATIVVSAITYGKDAYEKFKRLIEKQETTPVIVAVTTADDGADGE